MQNLWGTSHSFLPIDLRWAWVTRVFKLVTWFKHISAIQNVFYSSDGICWDILSGIYGSFLEGKCVEPPCTYVLYR